METLKTRETAYVPTQPAAVETSQHTTTKAAQTLMVPDAEEAYRELCELWQTQPHSRSGR